MLRQMFCLGLAIHQEAREAKAQKVYKELYKDQVEAMECYINSLENERKRLVELANTSKNHDQLMMKAAAIQVKILKLSEKILRLQEEI